MWILRWHQLIFIDSVNSDLLLFYFQGYYDNPKICALYVMKGTLGGELDSLFLCNFGDEEQSNSEWYIWVSVS